jgi:hypothetical protein
MSIQFPGKVFLIAAAAALNQFGVMGCGGAVDDSRSIGGSVGGNSGNGGSPSVGGSGGDPISCMQQASMQDWSAVASSADGT